MTLHTTGPWVCGWGTGLTGPTTPAIEGPTVAGREWGYTPVSIGLETVAICPDQDDGTRNPVKGSGEANARLIAAAPEQHAALLPIAMFPLEDFAQYDDCADMRVIFKANDWSLTVGDIRRARAAIAKATGATP